MGDFYRTKMEHRIIQYTLDGEFVKVWDNAHQAAESGAETASTIRKQTFGQETKKTPNFQWRFYSQDYPQRIAPFGARETKAKKPERKTSPRMPDTIEELDWTGEVVATYRDTADAAEKAGVSQSYICNILAGRIRHPKRRFRRAKN